MVNATKRLEMQHTEAINRMRALNFDDDLIEKFQKEHVPQICINKSDNLMFRMIDKNLISELIYNFEDRYEALVYYAILDKTEIGYLLSLLYVSSFYDEWDMDLDDARNGIPLAYVYNLNDDNCSEFGSIKVERDNTGHLIRIG